MGSRRSKDRPTPYDDEPSDIGRSGRRRRSQPKKKHKILERFLLGTGLVLLIVVGLGAWLGYEVKSAQTNLNAAKNNAVSAKDALLSGDGNTAQANTNDAMAESGKAKASTDSLVWKLASAVPYVGSTFDTVHQLTDVVDGLTTDVLQPAVQTGSALSPSKIRSADGTLDVNALRTAAPSLEQAAAAATTLEAQAQNVTDSTLVAQVGDARTQLINQTHELTTLLTNTSIAAKILPSMIGGDGPRSYFLAFQTNAESRGTGGLIGGFGIVRAVDGKVGIDQLSQNAALRFDYDPIDLGPEFDALYETRFQATSNWQNSNVSPNFPYAGQIWQSMWKQQTGDTVDGAVAIDPVALSYVLGAVGSITMGDGQVIDGSNVVQITQSDAYFRFADDNAARKAYLQDIAARVVVKMQAGGGSTSQLLDALGRSATEGHIAVWSADPAIQAVLAPTKIGHTVPDSPAPYAQIVTNNGAGGKLDYYMKRDLTYTAGPCSADTRTTQVTATFTNTAPDQNYPIYIAGRQNDSTAYPGPPGTNRTIVALYATQGAKLKDAKLNGNTVILFTGSELGHPVFYGALLTEPGKSNTLTYNMIEPTAPGEAQVAVQPVVQPVTSKVDVPTC